ncbi:MAG TPA: MopE-related protein [Sandaracinaceae bacterium LLY-WYZ-13_1]|nr:MopE-related protein [Sandaracinaceae bacterium LLY-WYZ-13_1]
MRGSARRELRTLWCVAVLTMVGCGDEMAPDGGTGGEGGAVCTENVDCADERFCTTSERCAPDDPAADARGCVLEPTCATGERCDEEANLCAPADGGGGDAGECDADGDGHLAVACGGDDCDDDDAERYPGNAERCGGMLADGTPAAAHDEDCDPCTVAGETPDGDADDDRYPSAACVNPWIDDTAPVGCDEGTVRVRGPDHEDAPRTVAGADCDDDPESGPNVRPNQVEICGNAIDDNCDGLIDHGTFFRDVDNDGRGDPDARMTGSCAPGWVTNDEDCDDERSETFLGAREICDGLDNDCSLPGDMAGGVEPAEDGDGDGHSPLSAMCLGRGETGAPGWAYPKDDCDDAEATIHTGAIEICGDGIDQDCDRVVDNPAQRICDDVDGDGRGDASTLRTIMSCEIPSGTVTEPSCDDCNDRNAEAYPTNREICDRVDNDCSSGGTSDASEDVDGDGWAPLGAACDGRGEAGVPDTAFPIGDCADDDATIHPDATEVCDRIDADCSSGGGTALDEDFDNDGHAPVDAACLGAGGSGAPSGAFPEDDCDDMAMSVHGGRTAADDYATCDGVDTDCDPSTSELTTTDGCVGQGYCHEGGVCGRRLEVVEIDASGIHTCARLSGGQVRCVGDTYGQTLGGPTAAVARQERPVVAYVDGSVQIGAGVSGRFPVSELELTARTCSLDHEGRVECWGRGEGPTLVTGAGAAVEVRSGYGHACVRLSGGGVRCWGNNGHGQLGDGTFAARLSPTPVPGLSDVRMLALGQDHSCALLGDGTVECWGRNDFGQLGTGSSGADRSSPTPVTGLTGVASIIAARWNTCALLDSGQMRCWGRNQHGQIGDGTTTDRPAPTRPATRMPSVVDLDIGGTHACAALGDRTLRCWGENSRGQLGDGTTTRRLRPTIVPGVDTIDDLALQDGSTCALRRDGAVFCWGDGSSVPALRVLAGAGPLSADSQTCAAEAAGRVWCWGQNTTGQIGNGTTVTAALPEWISSDDLSAEPDTTVRSVAAGGTQALFTHDEGHTCVATDSTGAGPRVFCWGLDSWGQLGDGSRGGFESRPTPVPGLTDPVQVSTGDDFSCARMDGGTVACWGLNSAGQLGIASSDSYRTTPSDVAGLTDAIELGSGNGHSCAVRSEGTLVCWGGNTEGQLGDGTTVDRDAPVTVSGSSAVRAIGLGGAHSCAVLGDGTVSCWGANAAGQLGDGTTTTRSTPSPVPGLTDVIQVVAGGTKCWRGLSSCPSDGHTCALVEDGRVFCWGDNDEGQLGDGTTTDRLAPTRVLRLGSVEHLTAGPSHTCATEAGGDTWCWGSNVGSALGDGTAIDRHQPTLVWEL